MLNVLKQYKIFIGQHMTFTKHFLKRISATPVEKKVKSYFKKEEEGTSSFSSNVSNISGHNKMLWPQLNLLQCVIIYLTKLKPKWRRSVLKSVPHDSKACRISFKSNSLT